MSDERTRPSSRGESAVDVLSRDDRRERDIGLITDELMREASPEALAEIRERTLRDPEFRQRRELLHDVWNARLPEEDLPISVSDDRIAEANLWRRIRENESPNALADRVAGRSGVSDDVEVPAFERKLDSKPERWYRVLPASWVVRIAIYAVLAVIAVAATGWVIHRMVLDEQAARAYQLSHPRSP